VRPRPSGRDLDLQTIRWARPLYGVRCPADEAVGPRAVARLMPQLVRRSADPVFVFPVLQTPRDNREIMR
jgi:hypothetical protein